MNQRGNEQRNLNCPDESLTNGTCSGSRGLIVVLLLHCALVSGQRSCLADDVAEKRLVPIELTQVGNHAIANGTFQSQNQKVACGRWFRFANEIIGRARTSKSVDLAIP